MSVSKPPVVVGLGELLWDEFGAARRPGGAPANVAFQAMQLGCEGVICSRVGKDESGEELCRFLSQRNLNTEFIQQDIDWPTGRVTVDDSSPGHPEFIIHENVAWDALALSDSVKLLMQKADAICFGTLAQRSVKSRETIQCYLDVCGENCLKVFDVNLRQKWYSRDVIEMSLQKADVLKLNVEEVNVLCKLLDIEPVEETDFCQLVAERFGISRICVTRAEQGCLLSEGDQAISVAGEAVDVVDAVGAGDALTAALIVACLEDWPLENSARFANAVGASTTIRSGAMSSSAEEFAGIKQRYQ